MSRTKATTVRPSKPATAQLSTALHATAIGEARTEFDELDTNWGIVPTTHRDRFEQDWAAIAEAATKLELKNAGQLVTEQPALLSSLTGESKLATFKAAALEDLHRLRNTIVMVTAGAAAMSNLPVEAIYHQSVTCPHKRTPNTERPAFDDEIALLRTAAAITITNDPTDQAALMYALCDAGMLVAETTYVTLDHFDDLDAPTMAEAQGNRARYSASTCKRLLPLERFTSQVIARATTHLGTDPATKVVYRPRLHQDGSPSAAASACGVIRRFITPIVNSTDLTGSSIPRWRIAHTLDTQGEQWAKEIAGCPTVERVRQIADRKLPTTTSMTPITVTRF